MGRTCLKRRNHRLLAFATFVALVASCDGPVTGPEQYVPDNAPLVENTPLAGQANQATFANITHTLLTGGSNTGNQKVYTTAAIAPAPNTLILVAVLGHRSANGVAPPLGAPPSPTVSGGGMTAWTVVATITFDSLAMPLKRLTIYRAMSAAPGSGPLTITFPYNVSHCLWSVSQFGGAETSGVNGAGAIGQTGSTRGDAASGLAVLLGAFGNSNNVAYGVFGVRNQVAAVTPGAGFTELSEQPAVEWPPSDLMAEGAVNVDRIAATWTNLRGGALGVEIRAAASLTVTASTTGAAADLDPDGYTVTVNGNNPRTIATGGSTTYTGLSPSNHTVALNGVAGNCTVTGENPRPVIVTAGNTAATTFSVSCGPTTGSLTVAAATTGAAADLDPDGYTVTANGSETRTIAINGSTTYTVPIGSDPVALSGVAANCTVSGGGTRTVTVAAGSSASTTFSVSCAPTTGSLTVSTATTGAAADLDANGYTVTVDGETEGTIGTGGTATYNGLAPGDHAVALNGLAANCSVTGGNTRTVSISAGNTVNTPFSVSCGPTTGNLTVSTATTGAAADLDPDGYTLIANGDTRTIPSNGSTTYTAVSPGNYTITLNGVAANCTVSGGNTRSVTITAGQTATTTFSVSCGPTTGNLTVSTATTGAAADLDPDGYTVANGTPRTIPINGTISYTGVSPGIYTITLNGVAANCTVSGGNTRSVTITAGQTATTTFSVSCAPTTGDLIASAATSGPSPDPDGYTVTLDGGGSRVIGTGGSTTYIGLPPGDHSVALSGLAGNCSVTGTNPRPMTVTAGNSASTIFSVSCASTTGDLIVSAATSGPSPDPDGYTVTVDGGGSRAIGTGGSTTYTGLLPGGHTVALSGVAGDCIVSGGTTRTVTVTAGNTASTIFSLSCGTGNLTVMAATAGAAADLDPDGYTVIANGTTRTIPIGGSTTYTGVLPGSYAITLNGLAANCTVSGANPRTVAVTAGQTFSTTFSVSCGPTTGNVTVMAATTGAAADLDPDGYTVTKNGGTPQAVSINGGTTYTGYPPANYSIALNGVAGNCTVSGANPRIVTITAGQTASTTFSVSCGPTPGNLNVSAATTGAAADLDPDGYTVTVNGGSARTISAIGSTTYTGVLPGSYPVALNGVAANCTVSGANPRSVIVTAGGTASTQFDVSCAPLPPTGTRVTGHGAIGLGTATPGMDRLAFDFEVTSDPIGGTAFITDYSVVRQPSGRAGTMTVNRTVDPTTGMTSLTRTSATCVRIGGMGRLDTNELFQFFIDVCDNASPGAGFDTFTVTIPDRGGPGLPFTHGGTVTEGDIVIVSGTP